MKPFNTASLITLVISNMIGAGVFTTSGFIISDLGDPRLVIFAWLVALHRIGMLLGPRGKTAV